MKKKIVWLIVSCLMVTALILASCGPEPVVEEKEAEVVTKEPEKKVEEVEEPEEKAEEEVVEEPAVGEPQYGGTYTMLGSLSASGPASWDQRDGIYGTLPFLSPFMEHMLKGDVVGKGPRGTNEWPFRMMGNTPMDFVTGSLAESWEWTDPLTLILHLRQGVMFAANPHIGFEPREYTAYDAEFCLKRYRESPRGEGWIPYIDSWEVTDKYTFVVHCSMPAPTWGYDFGYDMFYGQFPREVLEAPGGAQNWRNQVGTGPFILTDYVSDVSVTYERNPDWWDQKQVIDGKEYQLPFIDKLVFPIIPDESTQIAGLRTGVIDLSELVTLKSRDSLARTCPELESVPFLPSRASYVNFQWKHGPFTDKKIRQAIMIGTDLEGMTKALFVEGGNIQCFPFSPQYVNTSIYTPIEDLPPETQLLYDYNPDLAKQMLADAGYPEGLKIDVHIDNLPESQDRGALLASMWEKIGVEATLYTHEVAHIKTIRLSGDYEGALIPSGGVTKTLGQLLWCTDPDVAFSADEYFVEAVNKTVSIVDVDERNAMVKELGVYVIDSCWLIGLGIPKMTCMYWPWLKNYYGELESTKNSYSGFAATLWIDQVLKAKMGY